VGFRSGRRLTADDLRRNGVNLTAEQLHDGLSRNFTDVANRLGVEFFTGLPAVLLEQFTGFAREAPEFIHGEESARSYDSIESI
jgi:hypothetical protein